MSAIQLPQMSTAHVYDVPVSNSTTALPPGAPETLLETPIVSEPMNNDSNSTFQRLGLFGGKVGRDGEFDIAEYVGSTSPIAES